MRDKPHASEPLAHHRLQNYLRTYRRKYGFSQAEIALLIGIATYGPVSRYEHFTRRPELLTVFALEVIFNQPASELLAGFYEPVRDAVLERARELERHLSAQPDLDRRTLRKIEHLRAIVGTEPPEHASS